MAAGVLLCAALLAARGPGPLPADDDCAPPDRDCFELAEHQQRDAGSGSTSRAWPAVLAKPAIGSRLYGPLERYVTAFGVIDSAAERVGAVLDQGSAGRGKWGFGHCVCEICHTVIETLQLKLFQDYGLGFQDQDVYDVIEDSFCDSFLPYYRSGCQWILSYKYASITPLLIFMAPYGARRARARPRMHARRRRPCGP